MVILPDERVPIARLLVFLEHGERMANACAHSQAALAPDSKTRRFFNDPGATGGGACGGLSRNDRMARSAPPG